MHSLGLKEDNMKDQDIKNAVRKSYARTAKRQSCCGPAPAEDSQCCTDTKSKGMGYTTQDVKTVPEGSNLGLGCGNPVAIASQLQSVGANVPYAVVLKNAISGVLEGYG